MSIGSRTVQSKVSLVSVDMMQLILPVYSGDWCQTGWWCWWAIAWQCQSQRSQHSTNHQQYIPGHLWLYCTLYTHGLTTQMRLSNSCNIALTILQSLDLGHNRPSQVQQSHPYLLGRQCPLQPPLGSVALHPILTTHQTTVAWLCSEALHQPALIKAES